MNMEVHGIVQIREVHYTIIAVLHDHVSIDKIRSQ